MTIPPFLKNKMLWIGVFVVIAGFSLFQAVGTGNDDVPVVVTTTDSQTEEERDILRVLEDLRSIDFDIEFLESAAFLSLEDFTVPIEEGPRGRQNPFAPIEPGGINLEEESE
jgi:hypothetical protein